MQRRLKEYVVVSEHTVVGGARKAALMRRFILVWGILALLVPGVGSASAQSTGEIATYDIVVVGGESAVSPEVFQSLQAMTTGNVVRVSGPDRYATAAAVSEIASEPGLPVVFVATGQDFPDALVVGPVAAQRGGSVLLVERDRVPEATRAELARLRPERVVALGGGQAISQAVLDDLAGIAGTDVDVISGPTRFSTAAAVSRAYFSPGVPLVYVATGLDFADALTAVPAAAVESAPILLTGSTALPPSTRAELTRLRPGRIAVVGGQKVVTGDVVDELAAYTDGTVERVSGAGREATAANVSESAFPAGAGIVFVATGADFPDALAIGAAAGAAPHERFTLLGASSSSAGETPGPVLLTRSNGLPEETVDELIRLGRAVPAPLAQDQEVDTDFQTPVGITLTAVGGGGAPFTFAVSTPPQHGTLSGTAPNLTYTPDAGFTGTDTFEFTASIGAITSEPATVTVNVEPPGTPIAHAQSVTAQFETPMAITLTGTSPDGLTLTYAIATPPSDGTLSGTAPNVTYTPDAGFEGDDEFTFTVSDGIATSAPASVSVTVFPDPPVAQDVTATTDQDAPVLVTLDADSPGGHPLTYHYDQPDDGTVTGAGPGVTYTPDPGFHGTDTFDYHVDDGFNDSNTATVTVTVVPLPPVAHDQDVDVPKGAVAFVITLQADNPSGGPLTYTIDSGPGDGAAVVVGDGPDVDYTPDPGFEGTDAFTWHVNDTFANSIPATVTIDVEPAAPVAQDVSAETDQDVPVVITLDADNFSNNPLTYDYDQPDDGTVTGAGEDVTYTPDPGFHDEDTFTFYVNDGFVNSNTATVTVTVHPAHPVADDQSVSTAYETPVDITLEAESPSGGPLTFQYTQPGDGTVTGTGPGVTYTPDDGFQGEDSFTFYVDDTFNDSNTATVTVTVEPPPPIAYDVSEETDQDTPVLITLDADNFSANPLTYHYEQPDDGTVTGAGPGVTYTPDPGFYGEDTFTYHVNDGFNDSNTVTVTVTVNFTAEDYEFDAVGNTLLEVGVTPSGDPAVDVDATLLDDAPGPGFTVVDVDTSGTSGAVDWNADGTFSYEPAAGFNGDDSFVYTISDGEFSGSGTVTVTVADLVWYVDGTASGDGRSWSPFASLAGAEADSGPGDIVFVYEGSGDYTDGIALQADQQLLGEEAGLSVAGHVLVAPGARPSVNPGSGDAIGLASGVEVQGLDVTGAAGQGLVASNTGGTVTVTDVDVSGVTGNALRVTGAGTITLTGVTITNTGGSAVSVDGLTGSLTSLGAIVQSGTDPAVAIANLGASASVELGAVTSAASGITVAASGGAVEVASATLGSSGIRISGQPGLDVSGGDGTVEVGALSVHTSNAPAIALDAAGTVTVGGGTVDTTGAPVLAIDDATTDITLASATSASSPSTGIDLSTASGSVSIGGGSITGSTGNAVHVDGGSVSLTAAVTVTNASGNAVRVNDLGSGSVALSGAITDTGSGINLTGNTGSTVAFTGQLGVTTTGSTAFAATGGGTVTATSAGSTLAATNARGLQVTSTTIGAAGLRFTSISASNSVHGIELSSTGTGALLVDGDGSTNRNGAGGTITTMSSHGVTLTDTGPVTLRNMNVNDNTAVGVRAGTTTGLTVIAANILDNTNDHLNPATRNNVWLREVTGTARIEDSMLRGSAHNQIDVENTAGTLALSITGNTILDNDNDSAVLIEALGSTQLTLDVTGNTITGHHATGVHAFARNTSDVEVTVHDNTFDDNNVAVNVASWHTATLTSTLTDNTVSGHASHSINATSHDDSTHDTTITGNAVDATATVASVGVRLVTENDSLMRALVNDNTVAGQAATGGHGVRVLVREGTAALHLELRGNDVDSDSNSPAYEIVAFDAVTVCADIAANTGASANLVRDMLFDIDTGATAQVEGAPLGALSEAQLDTALSDANPAMRVQAFLFGTATGVAAGTCQAP
jgi:putative cell wall-binding protein